MAGDSPEKAEVVAFLREAGLQMYIAPLLKNGFDDLDTLMCIEDTDMKELGLLPQHSMRLRRTLNELKKAAAAAAAAAEAEERSQAVDPNHPVVAFLREVGLEQYTFVLLESGFDEMESLMLVEDQDLKDLGFARGHAVKLKKKLRDHDMSIFAEPEFQMQELEPPALVHQPLAPNLAPVQWQPRAGGFAPQQVPAFAAQQAPAFVSQPAPLGSFAPMSAQPPSMMAMSPGLSTQGVTAVEWSWSQVQALGAVTAGELLYKHCFALEPAIVELFPPEVRRKYREWADDDDDSDIENNSALRNLFAKVLNAVGTTVAGLHDMTNLVPMLRKLGARHLIYRVQDAHFEILGRALDLTLGDILGSAYTHEVQQAWSLVFAFMSAIMLEGLRQAEAAAQPATNTGGARRAAGGAGSNAGSQPRSAGPKGSATTSKNDGSCATSLASGGAGGACGEASECSIDIAESGEDWDDLDTLAWRRANSSGQDLM